MHDAFKDLKINTDVEKDYVNVYYYFKRANLKWRGDCSKDSQNLWVCS